MLNRIIALSFCSICLLSVSVSAEKWGKVSDEEWRLGPPEEYPEANAATLFDIGRLKVTVDKIELERHVRIKIFNKAGIEEVGDIEFDYYKKDKIKGLKAHTITPNGKKRKVDKKEFYTKSLGSWEIKSFSFPSLDSGCIIEYKYTNLNERWHRLDPWYFQSQLYTLYSEFSLVLGPGFVYSSATMNVPPQYQEAAAEYIPNPDDLSGPRLRAYTWKMNHLPPIKDEPYMSFRDNYRASLYNQLVSWEGKYNKIRYIKDWKDMGETWETRLTGYVNKEKEIKKIADSLTAGIVGKREQAEKIYDYVTNEYGIIDSEGRWWANENLWEFVQKKSGTEDEINILLLEMLQAANIPAWPLLIGTRDKTVFVPRLCMEHQFNHLITFTEIDSSVVYLDASSKYCPFGILRPKSRVTGGLLIDGKKSQLVRILLTDPESYRVDLTKMYIGSDGVVKCSTCTKFSGYFASRYGGRCDAEKPEEFLEDYYLGRLHTTYDAGTPVFQHESPGLFQMDVTYRLDDYIRKLDNNLVIRPVRYDFSENPFKSEKRFFPVDFDYPFVYENMVLISLEDSTLSRTLPGPISINIPGASFTRNCMFDGVRVIVKSRLAVEKPIFPQALYAQLRDFFSEVVSSTEDEIIFTLASQ